jgi:hypothetical protein
MPVAKAMTVCSGPQPTRCMITDQCLASERLVHAPLSALMMLETLRLCHPKAALLLKGFTYRAINPMILNKQLTIHGSWNDRQDSSVLWMVNEDGQVGMTATVELYEPYPGIGTALH